MASPIQNRRRPRVRQALRRIAGDLWVGWDLALLLGCYLAIMAVSGFIYWQSLAFPFFPTGARNFAWSPPNSENWLEWFGRDGRTIDMMLRIIRAGAVSLWAAFLATALGAAAGLAAASAMALTFRERGYRLLSGVAEVFFCVPAIVLALILFVGSGGGFLPSILIFGGLIAVFVAGQAGRQLFLLEIKGDVLAARGLGYSRWRLLHENLMSRLVPGTASLAAGILPVVLLAESAASFAGFGLGANSPSLGGLVAEGRTAMFEAPWLLLYPGLALWLLAAVLAALAWSVRRTARARVAERIF